MKKSKQIRQTKQTFGDKWRNNPNLARSSTIDVDSRIFKWIIGRNGFKNVTEFETWLSIKSRILDAGCGNGRIIDLFLNHAKYVNEIVGVDINPEIAKQRFDSDSKVKIFGLDISRRMKGIGQFDFIYCQEVLHHTQNPQRVFNNLVSLLTPAGEIAIYVYKKKSPAREFMDEFIREKCQGMSQEEKTQLMREITEFGRNLQEQKLLLHSPGIEAIGIPRGDFPMQMFIYDHFMKCFWNPELNLEENVAINEDWYYPQIASKHTLSEISFWYENMGLKIIHQNEDANGITVRGTKI